jgi:hypothetical protein
MWRGSIDIMQISGHKNVAFINNYSTLSEERHNIRSATGCRICGGFYEVSLLKSISVSFTFSVAEDV